MSGLHALQNPREGSPTSAGESPEESESDLDELEDATYERSDTEEELEKQVFGDSSGFREELKSFSLGATVEQGDKDSPGARALDEIDDADLFFTDLGGPDDNDRTTGQSLDKVTQAQSDVFEFRQPPAWEDSDDERIRVSLASVPRLRKLRISEGEDLIDGKEYSTRLRRQFEMLNPRPEWATYALEQPAQKRRRTSANLDERDNEGVDESDSDDGDMPTSDPLSKLLRNSESLVRQASRGTGKKRKLRPEVADIQRAKDIAGVQPSAITSLSFHPEYALLLSSGPSSTMYLHHITPAPPAPTPNPLLTSMHIRGTPLTTTAFHPQDARIFLSSRKRYFHIWDLDSGRVEKISHFYGNRHEQRSMERFKISPDGRHLAFIGTGKSDGGVVNIISTTSLQWTSQVRIEGRNGVADLCWWRNGNGMTIAAKTGEVSEWSLLESRIIARWRDEGAVGTTTIGLGGQHELVKSSIGTDRWIAVGSSSGIVNVYDRRAWAATASASKDEAPVPPNPKPTKTLDHLVTPVSNLVFSPDAQILVMTSRWKADAMKLVHLPSCTVFKNWPTSSTPLGRITAVAFARGEVIGEGLHSLMAVANEQGKIRLWEIR